MPIDFCFGLKVILSRGKTKSGIPEEEQEETHGESFDGYDAEGSIDLDQENEFIKNGKKKLPQKQQINK